MCVQYSTCRVSTRFELLSVDSWLNYDFATRYLLLICVTDCSEPTCLNAFAVRFPLSHFKSRTDIAYKQITLILSKKNEIPLMLLNMSEFSVET